MSVLTAPGVLGDLLKREYDRDYCREDVELVASADGYKMGTVLGKVTANGKYASSPAAGTTGEETACAVLLQEVPANGDKGLIVARSLSDFKFYKIYNYAFQYLYKRDCF